MLNNNKWESLILDTRALHENSLSFLNETLKRPSPAMNYRQRPRLREEIRSLMRAIDNTTNPPTIAQNKRTTSLESEVKEAQKLLAEIKEKVKAINKTSSQIPTIILN